ncbi:glycosyltransferase [Pseudoalteromonas sp. A3]|uniref:glycosyltransferase n=1 Tax=Pseudoalteromonas sp. A3 TaxID=142792 RepID=UPI002220B6D7|nr:glycosyltransferase [Pseudoalteromonas sp. A3]MCW1718688.1 glycosyltransferase [Pseudoalteromonas sp. A3]
MFKRNKTIKPTFNVDLPAVFVDGLVDGQLKGWAQNADTVIISLAGEKLAEVPCKDFRQDLEGVLSNPNASFNYALTKAEIKKEWRHLTTLVMKAEFIINGHIDEVAECIVSVEQLAEQLHFKIPSTVTRYSFDGLIESSIAGWCDEADYVELYIEHEHITSSPCNVERTDLADLVENTCCGFSHIVNGSYIKPHWFLKDSLLLKAVFKKEDSDAVIEQKTITIKSSTLLTAVKVIGELPIADIAKVIEESHLWDEGYYFSQLDPDEICHANKLYDFIIKGASKGKNPNPHFNICYYLATNPDVAENGINPFYHYLIIGESEGRKPQPLFNPRVYLENNQDLKDFEGSLLTHFVLWGESEKRPISDLPRTSFETKASKPVLTKKDHYQTWCEANKWNSQHFWALKQKLSNKKLPKLSIIMPVYNPPMKFFKLALKTIEEQVYGNWELCIADDCSTDPNLKHFLEEYSKNNDQVKICFREENGHISAATNSAAELATGDFLVFMDQDDEITPDALAEIALYIDANPESDVIYTDDDKNDPKGNRFAPQFKPEWSPELLLSYMYMCHIFTVRTELYKKVGGTRLGYEGSQDYDLALRVTEKARHVGHIPKVLYHWRVLPGSTAASGNEKHYSFVAGINAVQDALDRRGIPAKAYQPEWAEQAGCGVYSHAFGDNGPSVALIIPTKNQAEITKRLLVSLEKTTYKNFKVYIVNNESDEESALALFEQTEHTVFDIKNKKSGFSYAYVNNQAVNKVKEELVLFLNNDTEVITPNWLSQMVGYLQIDGVGAVGARLLYPDNTVQHAGVLHDLHHGLPGHSLKHLADYDGGYMGFAKVLRNYSCVTAACLLMRRDDFNSLGQFDEKNFAVAYNDVDLCYRILESGKRVVYAPTAELYHYEGKSRGYKDNPKEEVAFVNKYKNFKEKYYNPNLVNSHETFNAKGRTFIDDEGDLSNKKVAFFSHNLNLEGAPIQLLDIAAGLKESKGIEPLFISPQDGPLRKQVEELGIEVAIIPPEVLAGIQFDYFNRINLITNWLNKYNIDVIFANTILCFWGVDVAEKLGISSVWIIHESETPFSHISEWGEVAINAAKACLGHAYQVVFVSEATKNIYQPYALKQNYSVIYNGFDDELMSERVPYTRDEARAKLNLKGNEIYTIIVGTVCERKGQVDLIKAIELLEDETVVGSRFAVIGDRKSDYSDTLHEAYKKLPAERQKKIAIIPETRDVGLYYAAADIFVCCSRIESFPRVIQEAMHCGLAIVTTPVFGIAEQVKDEVSALFYGPGDVEELSIKLSKIIINTPKRKSLITGAKYHLKRLPNYESMVKNYSKLIQESLFL